MTQLSIFDTMETTNQTDAILFELRDINLSNVTPMDAMNLVYKWQNKLKRTVVKRNGGCHDSSS